MTPGQVANGFGSGFTTFAGGIFVISYALLAKWYKSLDGRMTMLLGAAVTITCGLTLTLTLFDFRSTADVFRFIQAGLVTVVGLYFLYWSIRVWGVQRKKGKHRNE